MRTIIQFTSNPSSDILFESGEKAEEARIKFMCKVRDLVCDSRFTHRPYTPTLHGKFSTSGYYQLDSGNNWSGFWKFDGSRTLVLDKREMSRAAPISAIAEMLCYWDSRVGAYEHIAA